MEHPPVRFIAAGLALAACVLFTGRLSYSLATRPVIASASVAEAAQQPQRTSPAKASAPKPAPAASQTPAGPTHTVKSGETLSALSRLYGVGVDAIRRANGLPSDQIKQGQRLVIPGGRAPRRHTVVDGDTLWELTVRYGVTLEELLRANPAVDSPGHLAVGLDLIIPGAGGAVSASAGTAELDDLSLGGKFMWPVTAPISSTFGPRWGRNHAGVDLAANSGVAIKSARDGKVVLAGTVQGYGETVILEHSDGTRTLYAHCSKLLVRSGQSVKQGEVIAEVGSTGHSTGPHLHFEIIVNGKPRDPLLYLPKR